MPYQLVAQGRQIFRPDTFGNQAFWGGTLKLHQAIEGAALGAFGAGVSPPSALKIGLKVDADVLPSDLLQKILNGGVNLNDAAVTVQLVKLNAVVWGDRLLGLRSVDIHRNSTCPVSLDGR
jgi:hypothetical protein